MYDVKQYELQAEQILERCNATMDITFVAPAINRDWSETKPRNLYSVTLKTARGSMTFDFWDSLYNTENNIEPNSYDVLACVEKYDPGMFKDFCTCFDYNDDSIHAMKIYFAVQEQYAQVARIFTPQQLEALREIV